MSRTSAKFVAILLLAALCIAVFVSCSETLQGVDPVEGDIALTVGGYDVSATEYDYYYDNYVETDGYGEEDAKEAALYDVKRNRAVFELAKEYDIELTENDRKEIDEMIADVEKSVGGSDAFEENLKSYHMTRGLYVFLMQTGKLETLVREYVTSERAGIIVSDDKTVEEDIYANFFAVKQILIANDEGEDPAENKALADEIYARILAGGDFDALCAEYNEDGVMDPVYGRYFTDGMFHTAFEEAAKALKPGEIGGVVETPAGYHIIMRVEIDPGYVDENFEQLRVYYLTRCFNKILEERIDALEVKWED